MAVPYDYYRIFYHVAQQSSFTRAAAVLGNNQPNVTRCMNNLEQELGCSLFQRGFSGITEKEMQKTAVVVSFLQETAGKKDLRRGAPCPRPLQARHAQA